MTTIEIANKNNYDKKFNQDSREFIAHWNMGREAARNAAIKINDMVSTTHQQYPDWSINKIAQRIYLKHQELEGFSRQTIYNNLDDENRQLLNQTKPLGVKHNRNNVIEQKFPSYMETNVIEDSSTTEPQISEEEADEILKDIEIEKEEPKIMFDQLPKPVLRLAEKIELSPNKLKIIANPRLKDHPELQKGLVQSISPLSLDQAKIKVAQKIRDLEDGYLIKGDNSYFYSGKPASEREIIKSNTDKVVDYIDCLEIMKNVFNLSQSLTGHKLEKGEHEYTKEIVDNTKEYRFKIAKSCNEDIRQLRSYAESFEVIRRALTDMLEILTKEMDVAYKNQDIMKN